MQTINVKAAQGLKCPTEGDPRKYITDSAVVTVPRTAYYIRLIADGSLILSEEEGK